DPLLVMHLKLSFSIYEHSYLCTLFNLFIGNDIITKEIDKSICKKKMCKNYVKKSKSNRFLIQLGSVLLFIILIFTSCFYLLYCFIVFIVVILVFYYVFVLQ